MIKACGECPYFSPVPESRRGDGINGDGWCDIRLPANIADKFLGLRNSAISKSRRPCFFGENFTPKNQPKQQPEQVAKAAQMTGRDYSLDRVYQIEAVLIDQFRQRDFAIDCADGINCATLTRIIDDDAIEVVRFSLWQLAQDLERVLP